MGSRLEKVGTIFGRITGLLRSGAMKKEDKPVWYDVYRAFPPKLEPTFGRSADLKPINNILYPEDRIRALFHNQMKRLPASHLYSEDVPDLTKKAIRLTQELLKQDSSLTENSAVDRVIKQLEQERASRATSRSRPQTDSRVSATEISDDDVGSTVTLILDDYNRKLNLRENLTTSGESVKDVVGQDVDVETHLKKE